MRFAAPLLLAFAPLAAFLLQRAVRRPKRWLVESIARADGTIAVILRRRGCDHVRVVRELEPGIDTFDIASDLRLAREDAQLQADELNRAT